MIAGLIWTLVGFALVPGSVCVAFYIEANPEAAVDLWLFFACWYVHWELLEVAS